MTRIASQAFAELIGRALAVAKRFTDAVGPVEFLTGVDPVFAGLHSYSLISDGRSYRETAHCVYPEHINGPADRRVTTIVLPVLVHPGNVVHELGHALDRRLGFNHLAVPVSKYALTNRREAFAEAFEARLYYYGDQGAANADRATVSLFDSLVA